VTPATRPGHFTELITLMGTCITCNQPKRPQDLLAHSGECRECYEKRGEKNRCSNANGATPMSGFR